MATTVNQRVAGDSARAPTVTPDTTTGKVVAAGSGVEAATGIGVVVLAILGLTGLVPVTMAAIATIAAGAALIFRGMSLAARSRAMAAGTGRTTQGEMVGGLSLEAAAGVAGIALGVLALLNIAPHVLLASALIAFGGALVLGAGTTEVVANATGDRAGPANIVPVAVGGDALVGIGAIVLGILALLDFAPETLILAGLVAVGAGVVVEAAPSLAGLVGARH